MKCYYFVIAICFLLFETSCNNDPEPIDKESREEDSAAMSKSSMKPDYDPSKSVTLISPNLYRQLSDTLGIRMLEAIYKPGDSSIMHNHPDFALYVLEGGLVELTAMDGAKQNIEFKKEMAVVLPADVHSAKNIGNTTLKLVVVEVDRPRE